MVDHVGVRDWESFTVAEQTIMRLAVRGRGLVDAVPWYGSALRWGGHPDAKPRSYTDEEAWALVPYLAGVVTSLDANGLITVEDPAGERISGDTLAEALIDPAYWTTLVLRVPPDDHDRWVDVAYPIADTTGLPAWDDLSVDQQKVLVCAAEASGMLTGTFGIWAMMTPDQTQDERLAQVDKELVAVLPFVQNGWIEVQHYPEEFQPTYAVIGPDDLRVALADPTLRYQGEDWGVGFGCVFTLTGYAVWRAGWSHEWGARLRVE